MTQKLLNKNTTEKIVGDCYLIVRFDHLKSFVENMYERYHKYYNQSIGGIKSAEVLNKSMVRMRIIKTIAASSILRFEPRPQRVGYSKKIWYPKKHLCTIFIPCTICK